MTNLVLIRHGVTEWNRSGLVQGVTDIPLCKEGVNEVLEWSLPERFFAFEWIASPLKRASETARLLSGGEVATDPRLAEMSWGEWEGMRLPDLREELGDLMVAWEAKGLDFMAPGGESPREVQIRISPLLAEIAGRGNDTVAVTHKGVIRAIYAAAVDWDMTSSPPEKMRDFCAHSFLLGEDGRPVLDELNINLAS